MPETGQEPTPPTNEDNPIESLPESWQTTIKDLRREAGAYRTGNKDLKAEIDAMKAEIEPLRTLKTEHEEKNGEYKTLYESTKAENDGLKSVAETNKSYESYFTDRIETVLEGQDETIKDLVNSSSKTLAEKLELAEKLAGDRKPGGSSQANTRPGGSGKGESEYMKRYSETKDPTERINILNEVKRVDPAMHARMLENVSQL